MAAEKEHTFRSHFVGIGTILLFFASVAFTSAGARAAFGYSPRPRILGWLALILSVAVGVWAMEYWVRVLPGILGCATLNGLMMITSGHVLNQPSAAVDRLTATLATLGLGLSAVMATSFKKRRLTRVDRIMCLGIFASFAIVFSASQRQVLGLVGMVACVIIAWVAERRRHVHHGARGTT